MCNDIIVFFFQYRGCKPWTWQGQMKWEWMWTCWTSWSCWSHYKMSPKIVSTWCDVFYHVVHMKSYCCVINVIRKEILCFISNYLVLILNPVTWDFRPIANLAQSNVWSTSVYLRNSVIVILCNNNIVLDECSLLSSCICACFLALKCQNISVHNCATT